MRHALTIATSCLVLVTAINSSSADHSPYSQAVKSLQPTYYYELNEPNADGGVIESMGNAEPGSYNGDYENGLPEAGCLGPEYTNEGHEGIDGGSQFDYFETAVPGVGGDDNLAHCSNNEGHILLGPSEDFGAAAMTVSMFMHAGPPQGGDRLFTNNLADPETSFQLNVANNGMVVAVDPNQTGEFAERTLWTTDDFEFDKALVRAEYGWFHVVASTSGEEDERAENIQLWINGENRTENLQISDVGWGINTDQAKIGGRHADPLSTTTHSGAQDEVAIWLNRVLTDEEVTMLWQTAIGEIDPSLPGDYNEDGVVDDGDIDFQRVAMKDPNPGRIQKFDESGDGVIDMADRVIWTHDHANGGNGTWIGDADLDGEFNSGDFVVVFTAGKYENGEMAGWAEGDWDGNMEFDSGDFVAAFTDGGYEQGPLGPAVAAVPEPSGICLILTAMTVVLGWRRRRV